MDLIIPALLLGQALGRWGNFFNGEAYGTIVTKATLENMKIIPEFVIKNMYINGYYHLPMFYFESLWCFLGFIIALILRRRKYIKKGQGKMKRLIIAVCMLVTGIAISIGGYVNLKSICRNMSCSVNEVIRAAENGDADETKRKCDDTEKMWDKKSPLLGVYTNHSEMDELMMLMKQIRQLSTARDYDELIEKCRESIYRFEHIAETETPSFGNVF